MTENEVLSGSITLFKVERINCKLAHQPRYNESLSGWKIAAHNELLFEGV